MKQIVSYFFFGQTYFFSKEVVVEKGFKKCQTKISCETKLLNFGQYFFLIFFFINIFMGQTVLDGEKNAKLIL